MKFQLFLLDANHFTRKLFAVSKLSYWQFIVTAYLSYINCKVFYSCEMKEKSQSMSEI